MGMRARYLPISYLYDSVYCEVLMKKCNHPDPRLAAKEAAAKPRAPPREVFFHGSLDLVKKGLSG